MKKTKIDIKHCDENELKDTIQKCYDEGKELVTMTATSILSEDGQAEIILVFKTEINE